MARIIMYALSTEKSIRMMESENKLMFRVAKDAAKQEIKEELEKMFKVKIESIQTQITKGEKRAYIKFAQDSPAIDIATKLGLM